MLYWCQGMLCWDLVLKCDQRIGFQYERKLVAAFWLDFRVWRDNHEYGFMLH